MVGKLLYLGNERPDAQVVIQYLAGKSTCPTEQALKIFRHPAPGVSILRGNPMDYNGTGSALVEAVNDGNFANDRETRRSLSSGQVYVNRVLVYSRTWQRFPAGRRSWLR